MKNNLRNLIKVLQILSKYGNPNQPIRSQCDDLSIHGIDPFKVSKNDLAELKRFGWKVFEYRWKGKDGRHFYYQG